MTGRPPIPFRFETLPSGCTVPVSHKLDRDGYLLKRVPGTHRNEGFHRTAFRTFHNLDEIPAGFEIDHLCGERSCFNVNHLQMIPISQHRTATHQETNSFRKAAAHLAWRWTRMSNVELGRTFRLSVGRANTWIQEWELQKCGPN